MISLMLHKDLAQYLHWKENDPPIGGCVQHPNFQQSDPKRGNPFLKADLPGGIKNRGMFSDSGCMSVTKDKISTVLRGRVRRKPPGGRCPRPFLRPLAAGQGAM